MKLKISKAEYEALLDEFKAEYQANGENYQLNLDGEIDDKSEDVEKIYGALKKVRQARKDDKKSFAEKLKELANDEVIPPSATPPDGVNTDPNYLALQKQVADQTATLEAMKLEAEKNAQEKVKRTILEKLRNAGSGRVSELGLRDLEMHASKFKLTNDGQAVTENGTRVDDWLSETLKTQTNWLPKNTPSGASGGQGGGSDLSLDAKKAKLAEFNVKENPTPVEIAGAHALALEVKNNKV